MTLSRRATLPLAVLLLGTLAGTGLIAVRPEVKSSQPERLPRLVQAVIAEASSVTLRVDTQGSVVPRTESNLVAEVSGRITWVSPRLVPGGFIEADEVLVRIDPRDHRVALRRAEAALARAESELELARSSFQRRSSLSDRGVASAASVEDARNALRVAESARLDAVAGLEQSRRDLSRTETTASFAGRVRDKLVDVGQYVARGAPLARAYAVDYAEVRLPISNDDAAFIELPIAYRNDRAEAEGPRVRLSAAFAGNSYHWEGRIVRTEGEIDLRTGMIHAVARVQDPYARGDDPSRPPLAVGLFVSAQIEGREIAGVISLPGRVLRGQDEVVVVDDQGRLRSRKVKLLQRGDGNIVVSRGIVPGERVVTSPLPVSADGLLVNVEITPSAEPSAADAEVPPSNRAAGDPDEKKG